MNLRLLVIGHWMKDHIVRLPKDMTLLEPLPRKHIHADVVSQIGGSGYHFSVGARRAGFKEVTSIICCGSDEQSLSIVEEAKRLGINIVECESRLSNAQAVLIYDTSDQRSSFGTRGSNLDLPFVARDHLQRNRYDLIFIAGHLLEDLSAQESMKELLVLAKENGTFVVFDLVPHHLHHLYVRDFFDEIFKYIDGLISKFETICPIIDKTNPTNAENVDEIINYLLTIFRWICVHQTNDELKIGYHRNDQIFVYSTETGYKSSKIKAGALDYPVARELYRFVNEQFRNS